MLKEVHAMNTQISIEGLRWVERWRASNGKSGTYVVPFPTNRPVNIVTHGNQKFDYGQYGIHLGQQDVLTFLGASRKIIVGRFIDCRKHSPTFRCVEEFKFTPSSGRTLIIPPGVAHTFNGLEGIITLNAYDLFLPPLEDLIKSSLGWMPESDIINLPLDIPPASIEGVVPMSEPAANAVYYRIGEYQLRTMDEAEMAHAETRTFTLADGRQVRLMLKADSREPHVREVLPASAIEGVSFRQHPRVTTGPDSYISPVPGPSPFYVVDHGEEAYDFDSYGIHLGQEDHLTFLGEGHRMIGLKLVDMRRGSPTLHKEEWLEFPCDPQVELIIPPGVAHALFNMGSIHTLNRPVLYLDPEGAYRPGNDVIDWPLADTTYPILDPHQRPASRAYLESLAALQARVVVSEPDLETPKAFLIQDPATGKQVKVVLTREPQATSSEPAR
jgi:dTDP-4-dehydrorhamnose 3,5-epimerase-like enzyme